MADVQRIWSALRWQVPWHDDEQRWQALVPPKERRLAQRLPPWLLAEDHWRDIVIVGPRRVGKTVVMQQAVRGLLARGVPPRRIWWLRLDHPELAAVPLGTLVEVVLAVAKQMETTASPELPLYLFLDEVTRGKDWDLWLKTFRDDGWPVRIVATSSATSLLSQFRRESGAGRWREIALPPWLLNEHEGCGVLEALSGEWALGAALSRAAEVKSVDFLDTRLAIGGFPEYLSWVSDRSGDADRTMMDLQSRIREEIINNAIYKDLVLQVGITQPENLERLMTLLAAQCGGTLSPVSLAQTLGVTQPTVDRYLGHLESTHLVFRLPSYAGSEEPKVRRGKKLYFADGCVRDAALQHGWRGAIDDHELGRLRENAVAGHLHAVAERQGVRLYHWREGKVEVDFVLDHPSDPLAVEVASSKGHRRDQLAQFQQRFPRFAGRCWLTWPGAPFRPAGDDVGTVALDVLLRLSGSVADAALGS